VKSELPRRRLQSEINYAAADMTDRSCARSSASSLCGNVLLFATLEIGTLLGQNKTPSAAVAAPPDLGTDPDCV
jgi:hypothetical protein